MRLRKRLLSITRASSLWSNLIVVLRLAGIAEDELMNLLVYKKEGDNPLSFFLKNWYLCLY